LRHKDIDAQVHEIPPPNLKGTGRKKVMIASPPRTRTLLAKVEILRRNRSFIPISTAPFHFDGTLHQPPHFPAGMDD